MKKNVRFVAFVGIFSAIGLVLDYVSGFIPDFWGAGGSISIAMVPIILMAYFYGPLGGLLTGLIIGSVQMIWGSPSGVLGAMLDYVIPYTVIGLSGVIINKKTEMKKDEKFVLFGVSIYVVGLIRVMSHTLSGVILYEATFWASFIYNAPYVLVSIGLCIALSIVLISRFDKVKPQIENESEDFIQE